MKIVIDTNTLIGHVLWEDSIPNQAVEYAFRNGSVLRSRNSYAALEQMILNERFDKYVDRASREKFLTLFKEITHHIEIEERHHFLEDASKNILLELAQNGHADYLITSQKEMLSASSYLNHTQLKTPSDFLEFQPHTRTTSQEDD